MMLDLQANPPIKGFFDDFRFLSNFWYAPMHIRGKDYASVEHYFQASKATCESHHEYVRLAPSAKESKRRGRAIECRPDWDEAKYDIMREAVEEKFRQNDGLKLLLLCTGNSYLEETNWWGDVTWGVCKGKGKNWLGKILMEVRELLRNERFFE